MLHADHSKHNDFFTERTRWAFAEQPYIRPDPDRGWRHGGGPQWPYQTGLNFAVNPIDGDQVMMTSTAGRIFSTADRGTTWQVIGDPQFLDGSPCTALAFGVAEPDVTPPASLNDFLYTAPTGRPHLRDLHGGGAPGNQWINISTVMRIAQIKSITTDPTRGATEPMR